MTRFEDWELKLHEFVEARKLQPFEWGTNDCALFVCDGLQAMTGEDIAGEAFRGHYSDLKTAIALMKDQTGGNTIEDVAAAITSKHGMEELPTVLLARRGDVVLFDGSEGPALGLVYLNGTHAVFVGPDGLRALPLADCRRAWRV